MSVRSVVRAVVDVVVIAVGVAIGTTGAIVLAAWWGGR